MMHGPVNITNIDLCRVGFIYLHPVKWLLFRLKNCKFLLISPQVLLLKLKGSHVGNRKIFKIFTWFEEEEHSNLQSSSKW